MSTTSTTEFEAPDAAAKAMQHAEGYHQTTEDLVGEKLVLNMDHHTQRLTACFA